MKDCPNCNASMPDVAYFCPKCRFNMKQYEEENKAEVLHCIKCGAELLSDAEFCMECGADVIKNDNSQNQEDTSNTFNMEMLDFLSTTAVSQLFENEGFKVENGVLVGYTGKKRTVTVSGSIDEIFDGAFKNNSFVTYIEIEEGVKFIGKEAFANCSSLVEVSIPVSCKKIYDNTFSGSKLEKLTLFERNHEIINNVISVSAKKFLSSTEINDYITTQDGKFIVDIKSIEALAENKLKKEEERKAEEARIRMAAERKAAEERKRIEDAIMAEKNTKNSSVIEGTVLKKYKGTDSFVKIPYGITAIGAGAFEDRQTVTSVFIPDSVTTIGELAFAYCSNLKDINIPSSVTTIANDAFHRCFSLTSINIPNSVTSIESYAFAYCTSLTDIQLPNSITRIDDCTFYHCKSLTSIKIPDSVTSIGDRAFYECTNLTSIKIPNGVESIGSHAFYHCKNLTTIEVPNSVKFICDSAFESCEKLKSFKIPKDVSKIKQQTFFECSNLESIEIPSNVTDIDINAFYGCTNIKNLSIDANNKHFIAIDGAIYSKDKETLIEYVSINNATRFSVPDHVKTIRRCAFSGCKILQEVAIPNSVTFIGDYAFQDCRELTYVKMSGIFKHIGYKAFYGCKKLKKVKKSLFCICKSFWRLDKKD